MFMKILQERGMIYLGNAGKRASTKSTRNNADMDISWYLK